MIGDAIRTLNEWCLNAIKMNGSGVRFPSWHELVPKATLADLGKDEWPDIPLALRLNIRRGDEHGAVRKWIPTASVLLNLILSGDPVKCNHDRGHAQKENLARCEVKESGSPKEEATLHRNLPLCVRQLKVYAQRLEETTGGLIRIYS